MVFLTCLAENCTFQTEDYEEALLAATMMNSHIAISHSNQPPSSNRVTRVEQPSISIEMTPRAWENTVRYWKIYKKTANLKESELACHLIACCEPDLRDRLMNTHSNIENESEKEALKVIKEMSVKSESIIVAQVNHMKCVQGRDEPIRPYYARLKGQAKVCDYTVTHTLDGTEHTVSFEDKILRQILATNIADNEIQTELLSQLNLRKTPMTADEMVNFIEAKENGKKSSIRLSNVLSSNAVTSSYKKNIPPTTRNYQTTQQDKNTQMVGTIKCSHCNTYGHGNHWGNQGAHIRRKLGCPAYSKKCAKCHRLGHFEIVCRSKLTHKQSSAAVSEESEEYTMLGGAVSLEQE